MIGNRDCARLTVEGRALLYAASRHHRRKLCRCRNVWHGQKHGAAQRKERTILAEQLSGVCPVAACVFITAHTSYVSTGVMSAAIYRRGRGRPSGAQ